MVSESSVSPIREWLRRKPFAVRVAALCIVAGGVAAVAAIHGEWLAVLIVLAAAVALIAYDRLRARRAEG